MIKVPSAPPVPSCDLDTHGRDRGGRRRGDFDVRIRDALEMIRGWADNRLRFGVSDDGPERWLRQLAESATGKHDESCACESCDYLGGL